MCYNYLKKLFIAQSTLGNYCTIKNKYLLTKVRGIQTNADQLHNTINLSGYPIRFVKVGHGPHVVFCLPGILGNMKIHTVSQIQHFDREKFTFVTWDQPGYACSAPPERSLNDNSLVEDEEIMVELMKKLGFPKYSVMGWSGGGCSALLAAIKHPETVNKLVVWGTFAYVDENDAKVYEYFQQRNSRKGKMMEILVDEYGEDFFGKHFGGWMKVFSRIYTHHGGEFVSKSLDKIKCSTLILHGSDDGLVSPKHGEYLNTNIKNSRLVKWEGGKHNVHLRYPDKFNRLVQDFLLERESSDKSSYKSSSSV